MKKLSFILFLSLSACFESEKEANVENNDIRAESEGFNSGECSDGADNDRDGMFDCDDPNCAGAPVCKLDENQNNQTDNNTDEEVRNYTVPTIWEVVDLNNTTQEVKETEHQNIKVEFDVSHITIDENDQNEHEKFLKLLSQKSKQEINW